MLTIAPPALSSPPACWIIRRAPGLAGRASGHCRRTPRRTARWRGRGTPPAPRSSARRSPVCRCARTAPIVAAIRLATDKRSCATYGNRASRSSSPDRAASAPASASSSESASITRAPASRKRCARARPTSCDALVTIAVLSSSEMAIGSSPPGRRHDREAGRRAKDPGAGRVSLKRWSADAAGLRRQDFTAPRESRSVPLRWARRASRPRWAPSSMPRPQRRGRSARWCRSSGSSRSPSPPSSRPRAPGRR